MKITELCLDGMDGNFGLVDEKWYDAAASSDETNGISNHILLIPNNSEHQQLFFDTLAESNSRKTEDQI